tara:strand:- start:67 stop:693 length:627 start_codon:yes stop_codon:yes gene_type:complete
MANGNALIAALRSATPQGITTAPGESTSFEAPWTNVSRRSLSDVLNMEAPFMPIESWRDTANIGPPYSGYKVPGYTRPDTDGTGGTGSNTTRPSPLPTPASPDIGEFESVTPNFWDDLNAEYADQYSAFGGSDEDWVDSNQFRNYQGRVLGGIENTYDTDKLQNDIAFFNTQLDDPIYGANAQMLKDAQEMQLAKISALDNFDTMNFY